MDKKQARYTDQYYAPTPTRWTLFWRKNLIFQAWRFIVLNIKIIKIVVMGHS